MGWMFKIEKRCLMWRGYRKLGNYYTCINIVSYICLRDISVIVTYVGEHMCGGTKCVKLSKTPPPKKTSKQSQYLSKTPS